MLSVATSILERERLTEGSEKKYKQKIRTFVRLYVLTSVFILMLPTRLIVCFRFVSFYVRQNKYLNINECVLLNYTMLNIIFFVLFCLLWNFKLQSGRLMVTIVKMSRCVDGDIKDLLGHKSIELSSARRTCIKTFP